MSALQNRRQRGHGWTTSRQGFVVALMLLAALGALLNGCGGGKDAGSMVSLAPDNTDVKLSQARKTRRRHRKSGSVTVKAVFPPRALSRRLAPPGTTRFQVVLWGPNLPRARSAILTPDNSATTFNNLPVGEKFVRADAYASADDVLDVDEFLGFGVTRVVVQANQVTPAQVQTDVVNVNVETVNGTQVINGVTTRQLVSNNGRTSFFRLNAGNGVERHGEQDASSTTGNVLRTFAPPQLFPFGLRVGQNFTQTVTESINAVAGGQVTFELAAQGVESILVPAGRFNALRLQMRETTNQGTTTEVSWLAPGVGMVMNLQFNGAQVIGAGVLLQANVRGATFPPQNAPNSPSELTAEHFPVFDNGNTFTVAERNPGGGSTIGN
jgi:hypothetical protein